MPKRVRYPASKFALRRARIGVVQKRTEKGGEKGEKRGRRNEEEGRGKRTWNFDGHQNRSRLHCHENFVIIQVIEASQRSTPRGPIWP